MTLCRARPPLRGGPKLQPYQLHSIIAWRTMPKPNDPPSSPTSLPKFVFIWDAFLLAFFCLTLWRLGVFICRDAWCFREKCVISKRLPQFQPSASVPSNHNPEWCVQQMLLCLCKFKSATKKHVITLKHISTLPPPPPPPKISRNASCTFRDD